ncbi:uncharacterized protein LOC111267808 [Varroa jacobsoni]|uniref:uncharacterized protein LOC111267808 n=1 Tax=Varroa jacobsoni TaxID=62625 RepID=UPI000BF36ECC|nr:uncharacterized protein LOC111267808 [Varroa jacobsoni]XP_022702057.1 uncharacterized protein LOC111267808 [Varroa jacobsoni]XP_022702058.1 uncharacterized protein LOC111267808 [Varroa jacobsoni]XP_022702059.1 uncharacterized protein LOC111267808 [Varroa jacobsoni]XP_022702060.1 uncharacterized protein LOC111267808 [Varroa jacobsoni]XP_022702061.1 uncharacterized protein LOC111267808 [Varroa jacobsoni]
MNAIEILKGFGLCASLNLYYVEVFSVAVTLVVYTCMLAIALGVVQRGTSHGVPLKNFVSGVIMSALALAFTDPSAAKGPAYMQNTCGVFTQLIVCLTILAYSADFNKDARLAAAGTVLFSVLANMRAHALHVLTLWSSVHLAIIPALDYVTAVRSGVSNPPDLVMLILMVSGTLSLLSWGTFILMSGLQLMAFTNFVGAIVAMATLKNMLAAKVKAA